jgi:ribosome-binding factor A
MRKYSSTKGRRVQRVASVIQQVVSTEIVTRMNDPRLAFVTVTGVEISPDLRCADVRVSILGDPKVQKDCMRAIRHAHGHIQEKVAAALVTRTCPICRFHLDESIKRSVSISAIIAKARAEDEANRADRIRRGVEPEGELPPVEEQSPVIEKEKDKAMSIHDEEFDEEDLNEDEEPDEEEEEDEKEDDDEDEDDEEDKEKDVADDEDDEEDDDEDEPKERERGSRRKP